MSRPSTPPRRRLVASLTPLLALALSIGPSAAADLDLHGLLDIAQSGRGEGFDANLLFRGDSPFDAFALRLFADGRIGPTLNVYTQVLFDDMTLAHVDGAYLMWTPEPARDLHLMAGKIPWIVGTWGPRTYSDKNPLIGTPLMYQHHTTLLWYEVPPSADALLASAGTGQAGVDYFGGFGARGMAVVDDSYWDVGAALSGSQRPFEGAFGFVNGTPGWPSTSEDDNTGKTVLGRIGFMPYASVRVGVSGAWGPYLQDALNPTLPAGHTANDYHQKLRMADAEFALDQVELKAEGFLNTWQTPTLGDLDVRGGYVEGRITLLPGLHAAARWDAMWFGDVADSTGSKRPWDHDVERVEAGLGYRLDRNVLLKAVTQRNRERLSAPSGHDSYDLVGAQLSVKF
jgi:hypothetical protein